MSKPEVVEKRPVCISLVKEALKRVKKRDEELNFRAARTEEYVNEVAKLKAVKAKELIGKLEELQIPRLKPEVIHKVVDCLPLNEKHLKVVLQGYPLSISAEHQKRMMKVIEDFLPKK